MIGPRNELLPPPNVFFLSPPFAFPLFLIPSDYLLRSSSWIKATFLAVEQFKDLSGLFFSGCGRCVLRTEFPAVSRPFFFLVLAAHFSFSS